ncbi:MAG: hypothetical protein ACM3NR_02975 [Methanosarcina sp.]
MEIKANLNNPETLEKLYRDDRKAFKAEFEKLYPEIENRESARFWKARLEFDNKTEILKSISFTELIPVAVVCLITAFLVKIPDIFPVGLSDEIFYMKNVAIIVFLGLSLYTIRTSKLTEIRLVLTGLAFLISAVYANFLPSNDPADQVILVYIHLPLLMWFIYGVVFIGYDFGNMKKRIDFIKFNGDLAIFYALIAIAGGILTGITIGLFESIGIKIEEFYFQNIVITGAVAAPVVASFLIEKFPSLISKAAPLIASIFSPLVLITLVVFLVTILSTGKDPYNDRDFLLIFNIMLLGVMGIIIFAVSETSAIRFQKFNAIVLFSLSIVTILIDLIALSAIFYRLGEYGLTPNRLAVLVSNILVLVNLLLIMIDLFKTNFRGKEFSIVENTVARFLPVYLVRIILVVFGFPVIFGMN